MSRTSVTSYANRQVRFSVDGGSYIHLTHMSHAFAIYICAYVTRDIPAALFHFLFMVIARVASPMDRTLAHSYFPTWWFSFLRQSFSCVFLFTFAPPDVCTRLRCEKRQLTCPFWDLLQASRHVGDLFEDLRDGHNLISLLEVLSGERLVSTRFPRSLSIFTFHDYLEKGRC